jgi:hypothetical protein
MTIPGSWESPPGRRRAVPAGGVPGIHLHHPAAAGAFGNVDSQWRPVHRRFTKQFPIGGAFRTDGELLDSCGPFESLTPAQPGIDRLDARAYNHSRPLPSRYSGPPVPAAVGALSYSVSRRRCSRSRPRPAPFRGEDSRCRQPLPAGGHIELHETFNQARIGRPVTVWADPKSVRQCVPPGGQPPVMDWCRSRACSRLRMMPCLDRLSAALPLLSRPAAHRLLQPCNRPG